MSTKEELRTGRRVRNGKVQVLVPADEPEKAIDTWTLTRGDCLDPLLGMAQLADRSVDHVITDPPYSEHVHAAQRFGQTPRDLSRDRSKRQISRSKDPGFEHITQALRVACVREFARVARRWVLIFSDEESQFLWAAAGRRAGLEPVRVGHWHKLGSTPQFTGDRPAVAVEAITILHKPGKKRWNGGGRHAIWSHSIVLDRGDGNEARVHTTQKPLSLMRALVADFTDPGESVLDPFAGSGTTGVAAVECGRRFIGWERNEKYHAIATARLRNAREQLQIPLTKRRQKKAEQFDLLGALIQVSKEAEAEGITAELDP